MQVIRVEDISEPGYQKKTNLTVHLYCASDLKS